MGELKPGYYWYRDHGREWEIIKVVRGAAEYDDGLILVIGNDAPFGPTSFQGQWGPRIEDPA